MTVLSSFFLVGVVERFHLAFPGGQAGLKRKEAKAITFKLSHLFIHSANIYSVPTVN